MCVSLIRGSALLNHIAPPNHIAVLRYTVLISIKGNYPFRHFVSVSVPMMIVQDEDRADHATGHHKHDAIKVRS